MAMTPVTPRPSKDFSYSFFCSLVPLARYGSSRPSTASRPRHGLAFSTTPSARKHPLQHGRRAGGVSRTAPNRVRHSSSVQLMPPASVVSPPSPPSSHAMPPSLRPTGLLFLSLLLSSHARCLGSRGLGCVRRQASLSASGVALRILVVSPSTLSEPCSIGLDTTPSIKLNIPLPGRPSAHIHTLALVRASEHHAAGSNEAAMRNPLTFVTQKRSKSSLLNTPVVSCAGHCRP
ncbi:hypothetical protein B0I35DRAFT_279384 [Stachybotrys elegans]|uniref:Uncharacterized protein n=1 Tax=Stachybotrys elegans TaxID=80388 RepID=A0A8K0SP86_9HYPO|nr:hypothetical protein B0I35DRAFT_279384 [Stachybotrys elegans]